MTAIPCPVQTCDRPRKGDEQVCGACQADLRRALADVPWLAAQLDIVLAKQGSHEGGGKRVGIPLPYDPRATEVTDVLRSTLVGWVRELIGRHAEEWPADTLPEIGRWLGERVERLLMHAAAEEAVDEICSAVRSATRLVDRRQERGFAGPCHAIVEGALCEASLYARPDAATVRCRECGAEYEVAERKAWMLADLEGKLLPAASAAYALTSLGWPVTGERIRQWAHRRRILAAGTDAQGKALYRVSEIRALLAEGRERMAV